MISAVLTPLFLVAGTFFPLNKLPGWAQVLGDINPLHHCVELVRHAAFGFDAWDLVRVAGLVVFGLDHLAGRDLRDDAQADRLTWAARVTPSRWRSSARALSGSPSRASCKPAAHGLRSSSARRSAQALRACSRAGFDSSGARASRAASRASRQRSTARPMSGSPPPCRSASARCGYLFVADDREGLARLAANVAVQNEEGIPSRVVSSAEAAELVPGLPTEAVAGGAWCAVDGYFDRPQGVVEAFAQGLDIRIGEVQLARELPAETVVVAAGADTPRLGHRIDLPIEREDRFLFYSEPIRERLLEPLVVSPARRFAAKQLGNGRVLASDLGARGDASRCRGMAREHPCRRRRAVADPHLRLARRCSSTASTTSPPTISRSSAASTSTSTSPPASAVTAS